MLTTAELSKLSLAELDKELTEVENELVKVRLDIMSRQSRSTSKLKDLRKQASRIKTFKRKLELAA